MTIKITTEPRAWLTAKLPNIRVAIPALRCRSMRDQTVKNQSAARRALEKQFREDYAHLATMKARPKRAPKPKSFDQFPTRNMSSALQSAA